MGYRSDVGLALSKAGKEKLDAAIKARTDADPDNAETKDIVSFIGGEPYRIDESGSVSFLWVDIKWYSSYPEVAFVEDVISKLDAEDYYFIRVGEADDDTEISGRFWENPMEMRLARGIAFD